MIADLNNIMVRFDGFQATVRVPGVYARQVVMLSDTLLN